MKLKVICAVLILANVCLADGKARILAVFSSLSHTDHLVFRGYISLLARRGHALVVMTPYPGHFTYPEVENILEIDVGEASSPFWDEYKKLMTNTDDYFPRLRAINEFSVRLAIAQIKSKQMEALLMNPNIQFDLVITEADVPLLYAIAEKYKAPHISMTTSTGKIHQHEAKGDPVHPIMFPDVNSLNFRNTTFFDEMREIYRHFYTKYEYYNNYQPLCEMAAKKLLGLKRPLREVEYDIDLLFIASNPYIIGHRHTTPAVIFVDRLQIKPGLKLPKDLLAILDSANKGVVYFSLGVMQEAETLSINILETLAQAFEELPFTVLWKITPPTALKIPKNVIAKSWFPQQEVLAHPNVKAFITHGGIRSLEEAIFYEVPIIGFPTVKSRKVFINEVTRHGTGEILDPYHLDKEGVKAVISNVMANKEYKQALSNLKLSIFNPSLSGPDKAVRWTEFLLRYKNARMLRSITVGMNPFRDMLEIYVCLIILALLWLYLFFLTIRLSIRYFCRHFYTKPQQLQVVRRKSKAS